MVDNAALYLASTEETCPIIDEPGINITAIIQALIIGVILWYLVNKR